MKNRGQKCTVEVRETPSTAWNMGNHLDKDTKHSLRAYDAGLVQKAVKYPSLKAQNISLYRAQSNLPYLEFL